VSPGQKEAGYGRNLSGDPGQKKMFLLARQKDSGYGRKNIGSINNQSVIEFTVTTAFVTAWD
jgi:hypothetical protein